MSEKSQNLEKTTSSVLSVLLLICIKVSHSTYSIHKFLEIYLNIFLNILQGEGKPELAGLATNLSTLAGRIEPDEEIPVILVESGVRYTRILE